MSEATKIDGEQRYATLGQINDRLIVIDDLIFKMTTCQLPFSADEQQRLEREAEWCMKALATGISEGGEYDYQTAWNERQKVRDSLNFAAVVQRYVELNPAKGPEDDLKFSTLFKQAAEPERYPEAAREMAAMLSSVFVQQQGPPAPPARPGFLQRLLRRG